MMAANILPEILKFVAPVAWILAAYLLGSIPQAWLLGKWLSSQALRRLGSGYVGGTNAALSLTHWVGLIVFLCEIVKGVLAVWVPRQMNAGEMDVYLCMLALVAGIRWPVWSNFKGRHGHSAGMAAFALISYPAAAAVLSFWVLVRLLLNDTFKATRLAVLAMPFIAGMVTRSWLFFGAILALSIIYLTGDQTWIQQQWASPRGSNSRSGDNTPARRN